MNPFLNNISVEMTEEESDERYVIKETVFERNGFDPISDLEQIENTIINNCLSDNEFDPNSDQNNDQNNDNLITNADNDSDVEIVAESKDDLLMGSQLLQQKYKNSSFIDIHKECKTQTLNEKLIRIQLDSELELERQQRMQFQQQLQEYTQTSLQRQFNDSKQIKQLKFELLKCRQELFTLKSSLNNDNNIDQNPNEFMESSSVDSNYKEFNCIDCSHVMKSEVSMVLHMINHCIDEQEFHLSTTVFTLEEFTDSMIDSVRKSVSYVCPRCGLSFNCVDIYYHLYKYHTKEKPLICTSCNIYCTHLDYLRAHHQESHSGIIHEIKFTNINNNERSQKSKSHNNGLNKQNLFRPYDINLRPKNTSKAMNSKVSSNTSANNKSKPNSSSSSDNNSDEPEIIHLSDSEPPLAQKSVPQKSMNINCRTASQPEHECTFADCDFKTTSKDKLNFHVSAHTNSKFKCPYCPYVGNVLNDIYRHIQKSKKHEGLRIYECRECDYGTNCLSTFKEHLNKRHFGAESDDEEDINDYIANMFRNEHSVDHKSDSS